MSDHWFKRLRWPGSPIQLAVLRIGVGLHCVSTFHTDAFRLLTLVPRQDLQSPLGPSVFPDALRQFFSGYLAGSIDEIGVVLGLMLAAGLLTRIAAPLMLAVFLVAFDFYFRATFFHDEWPYLWFVLLVLCFAPCADRWSLDAAIRHWRGRPAPERPHGYRWPTEFVVFWMAQLYFAAGIAKLLPIRKGVYWLEGATTQNMVGVLYPHSPIYAVLERPLFDYDSVWPFVALSVGTIVFECAAILMLFTRRLNIPIAIILLGMHASIYAFGVPGFFQCIAICFIALIPSEWFPDCRLERGVARA